MKLIPYSKKQSCYYCGALGPSLREHAPPKMMFAKFDCDSITVPSCDKHNTEKSIGDRAVITAMIMSASQMLKNNLGSNLTPNVITAIKHAEPDFNQAKKEVELRDFLIDPPEGLDIQLPYTKQSRNIRRWVRQLTAALVWSIIGRYEPKLHWGEALALSSGLVETTEAITSERAVFLLQEQHSAEEQFREMPWKPGWSAVPKKYPADIYSFDLCFPDDTQNFEGMNVVFRHRFYNSTSVWYVLFKATPEIINALTVASNQNNITI